MAAQRSLWRFSSVPIVKVSQPPPLPLSSSHSSSRREMHLSLRSTSAASVSNSKTSTRKKLPVLLFDVMDTLVRDPFYNEIPAFFGMSMKELLECKHPTAWIEFEKGLINEMELEKIFFKDGRPFDLEGLKNCMRQAYSYIEGIEGLLVDLADNGYEMHAATNYPIWYEIIEEKLKLSNYVSWTFSSCLMGKRKPDPDFYYDILKYFNVEPRYCIFVDDRMKNVEAAIDAGFMGIQFKNTDSLRKDLANLGIDLINKDEDPDIAESLQ